MCQDMQAIKEVMAMQHTVLTAQFESERKRADDLEIEVRAMKVKQTQWLLEGGASLLVGVPHNLDGVDKFQDLPTCSSRRSSKGDLKPLHSLDSSGKPTLYKANWKQMALFKSLSESNMNEMIKKMKVRSFRDGDAIVKQGTIGTTMFFIDLGGAKAMVDDICVDEDLKSGNFFGEMTFAYTAQKILQGKSDGAAGSEALKRACDVIACGATRCLELSVKDFLGVLKDDLMGSREAVRAIAEMAPLIDERRKHVNSIKDGSLLRNSSPTNENLDGDDAIENTPSTEVGLRAHARYSQDIIMADRSQELIKRRLEKKSGHSKTQAFDKALQKNRALLVPGRSSGRETLLVAQPRRPGWSAARSSNRELETVMNKSSFWNRGYNSQAGSACVSRASSKDPSRASSRTTSQNGSRQASPRTSPEEWP